MSTFADSVKQDTPRLVVMFRRDASGNEQYQWGVTPGLPMPALVGYITRAQSDIINDLAEQRECPEMAFVVAWDGKAFDWWIHSEIPVDSMVGMLEAVKAMLIGSKVGQRGVSQRVEILGPDGRPFPHRS